ncbi:MULTISPECIES: LPS assembly lipoprotein LptE [Legionella]|uniref:LPS-assembly lipoprotein LptE n=1 Tax=Legionella maceachernii TaxID=466 RepID=A0A0W0W1W8_9GAMM|nr:LPS assembly lipoprotein LptE [Legionella maceachernii]KTD26174.1 rare lipoprotein B [Legionella maceachernii]SJZ72036.1 LPS-assembly lipoprotein [Legionella maceachernii]SUP02405.1 LPS-assembly lipoprotein RlpB [Legionella maceachernii]
MLKHYFIIAITALLIGCGFHLRGLNDMPAWLNGHSMAIVIENAHRDLGPMLKDQLESYKVRVMPNPTQADYVLIIEADGIQQQITSVAASTAPRQYQLIYDVQFTVVKAKGGVIIPSTRVFVTRQLTVNSNRILGSNLEEAQISYEMRREAAMQIMNRVGRGSKNLGVAPTTTSPVG